MGPWIVGWHATPSGVKRMGGEQAARDAYEARYMVACDIYVAEQAPRTKRSIVVDNEDPLLPRLATEF